MFLSCEDMRNAIKEGFYGSTAREMFKAKASAQVLVQGSIIMIIIVKLEKTVASSRQTLLPHGRWHGEGEA